MCIRDRAYIAHITLWASIFLEKMLPLKYPSEQRDVKASLPEFLEFHLFML